MKKLEIEKTKPTFNISTFKTDVIKVGLVFLISNFFIAKTSLANKWMRKKMPSCSNSALVMICTVIYRKGYRRLSFRFKIYFTLYIS